MKEEKMEVAREVAQFIVSTDLSQIPAEVIEKGEKCILDALGCGLYGQEFEATKIVSQLAREWGGRPEASIIGAGTKIPSTMAALANGIAIHVADYDDSSVVFRDHPTSVVLPPVVLSILIYPEPHTGLEAKFSLQYCISSFLVHGKLDLSHFEKEAVSDPKVKKLMPRVKMVSSKELEDLMKAENTLAPAEIEVKLEKKTLSKRILEAKWGPSSPPSMEEVKEKFRICARTILSSEKVEKAIDLVSSLESLRQVNTLTEALNP